MRKAKYTILKDKSIYGEIPGFKGIWVTRKTLEDCREDLAEALEYWVFVNIADRIPLPKIKDITPTYLPPRSF